MHRVAQGFSCLAVYACQLWFQPRNACKSSKQGWHATGLARLTWRDLLQELCAALLAAINWHISASGDIVPASAAS